MRRFSDDYLDCLSVFVSAMIPLSIIALMESGITSIIICVIGALLLFAFIGRGIGLIFKFFEPKTNPSIYKLTTHILGWPYMIILASLLYQLNGADALIGVIIGLIFLVYNIIEYIQQKPE